MSLVFFTDRDLGRRFPEVLASAGLTVERLDDLFPPDCPDDRWLEYVGRSGRIAVTHDRRIRYKPNELAAVRRHGARLLVVVGKAPLVELARNFIATLPRIAAFLDRNEPPFIAKVYRPSPSELESDPSAPGTISRSYPS